MRIRLHFRLFLLCKKSASIAFGTKTQLAGKTLTPMPPASGAGNGQIYPQRWNGISTQPFTPRHGARRADVCGFAG